MNNIITTTMGGKVLIKNATKQGYLEAEEGDGIDISSRQNYHRGTVQKGIAQTLDCQCSVGTLVPLKRGYPVEVKDENPNPSDEIDVIGNYSKSEYNATPIVGKNGVAPTVRENHGQVTAIKSEFTELQAQMFTPEGDVRRYIGSEVVDKFEEGQCADISFPNGYNKGCRVHDWCPAINTTTTKSSFVVKTKNKRIQKMIDDNDTLTDPSYLDVYNQKVIPNESGTLKAGMDHQQGNIIYQHWRIRKLLPIECWRLMGFPDEAFNKAKSTGMSDTQLYKQAGNSIVVDVLENIFRNLFMEDELFMKKPQSNTLLSFKVDNLFDVSELIKNEPELYKELVKKYPLDKCVYLIQNDGKPLEEEIVEPQVEAVAEEPSVFTSEAILDESKFPDDFKPLFAKGESIKLDGSKYIINQIALENTEGVEFYMYELIDIDGNKLAYAEDYLVEHEE